MSAASGRLSQGPAPYGAGFFVTCRPSLASKAKKNPAEGRVKGLNVGRESVLVSTLAWRSALLTHQ
jgi:hypothetical protein